MVQVEGVALLIEFASLYLRLRDIAHFDQVDEEDLAESVREWFILPEFPRLYQLQKLCRSLGIRLSEMPLREDGAAATNGWYEDSTPVIKYQPDDRAEHSVGHELREIIEIAFKRAAPDYVGIDTSENDLMNPRSDRFAACLLMSKEPTRQLLKQLGFDLVQFSAETDRPLSAAVTRCQTVFADAGDSPVAAFWLFESPWSHKPAYRATPHDFRVVSSARINGFTPSVRLGRALSGVWATAPRWTDFGSQHRLVAEAVEGGQVRADFYEGANPLGDQGYVFAVEPILLKYRLLKTAAGKRGRIDVTRRVPRQAVMTAVRLDGKDCVRPWLERLDLWNLACIA